MFRPDPKPAPKLCGEKKWPARKKQKPIKKVSKKQDVIERLYSIVIKKIDQTREPVCSGCGRGDKPLSHSHLISRADCNRNGLGHLIAAPENIVFHCLSMGGDTGCHEKFEGNECVDLKDFENNFKYIHAQCVDVFNKRIYHLTSHYGRDLERLTRIRELISSIE